MKDEPTLDASDQQALGFDRSDDSWLGLVRDAVAPRMLGHIGEYELLGEIGHGAQGIVYRARQPKTRRQIALKRMAGGEFVSATQRIRFEREVETAAALRHPNIVTVFGMDVVDGQPLLAMEWIDGLPVDQWAMRGPEGPHSLRERLAMFLKVCDAVQHAHQRGVIHRDLKPSNILVDAEGQPRLLDFGLAKVVGEDADSSRLTLTHDFVGTPAYASPEQIQHGAANVDSRSDVYSLGVILYQLMTGDLPHSTEGGMASLISRVQTVEPDPPSSRNRALDKELDYVLGMALAKEPDGRYATVDALAADVRRYLDGDSVLAHPPSAAYQLRKFVRRHRWPVVFSATLLILIVVGATVSATLAVQLKRERDRAVALGRQEADARASAEAANDFLRSMFAAVDPRESRGREITARELLEQGGVRVREEFAGHPEVRATLLDTIGLSYLALGEYEDAEPYLREALALHKELFPEPHPAVNASLRSLALWYRKTGQLNDAERLAREALDMAEVLANPPDRILAGSMDDLAIMLFELGRYDEARALNREALAMREQLPDDQDSDVSVSLNNMAGMRFAAGDYAAADALLQQALALNEATKGDTHPDTLANLNNLAGMRMMLSRLDEAESFFREVLARRKEVLGERHPEVAQAMNNLAEVLRQQGRLEEAEALFVEALALRRAVLPAGHLDIARTLNNLALTVGALGNYEAAVDMQREALAIRQNSVGPEHPLIAVSLSNLAFALHKLNRIEEAESVGWDALARRRAALGEEHPEVAITMIILADILVDADRPDEAESIVRDALAIQQQHGGVEDPVPSYTTYVLGRALAGQGRFEEAEPFLLIAWERRSPGGNAAIEVETMADFYDSWGRSEEADRWRSSHLEGP